MGELMAGLRPNPYTAVVPKIYAYTTPEKIGRAHV